MQYQKEEVKSRILAVAFAEFNKEGYYKANVLRIATHSKVAIGNLYRYFNGKAALFDALVGQAYSDIPVIIQTIYDQTIGAINDAGKLYGISEGILMIFDRYGKQLTLLLDKSQGSKYAEFGNTLREEICTLWKQAFAVNGEDDFMIELLAEGFLSGSLKIFKTAKQDEMGKLLDRLMRFYFQNIKERF